MMIPNEISQFFCKNHGSQWSWTYMLACNRDRRDIGAEMIPALEGVLKDRTIPLSKTMTLRIERFIRKLQRNERRAGQQS